MTAPIETPARVPLPVYAAIGALGLAGLWAYWPTLLTLAERWGSDPQYSHGFLVPAFAGYLLWLRRDRLAGQTLNINALGLALIAAALALRLFGTRFHYQYFDQISLLPCLAGVFLLLGGWRGLFWSLPGVAFLAFMIPLPHTVSHAMSGPMQSLATTASTFLLQAIGRPALAEGNVILLNEIELGIVEACSGLRMLVVFFALSTAVALLIQKPLWEKLLIAGSAIPIALAANILRITITGICYDSLGNHFGGALLHDIAGWLMMPLGLAFLGVELWILRTLLIDKPTRSATTTTQVGAASEINPVAMYRGSTTSRREKAAAVVPAAPELEPELEPEPIAAEAN